MKKLMIVLMLVSGALRCNAQTFSVETNLLDYANLGTINLEANVGVSQHVSLLAGGSYNDWEFEGASVHDIISNKQKKGYAGFRYWPWHIYSGWWFAVKGQWQEYGKGGVWRPALEEGTAIGAGALAGYTLMMSKHLNLNFALGVWGGSKEYTLWNCRHCNRIREQGKKGFVELDNVYVSLAYIF